MYHVYLLRCADDTIYTGITNDLARRLKQHNAGTASKYTRSRRPVRLIDSRAAGDRSAALKLEAAIKALPRRKKIAFLRSVDPVPNDLSERTVN